MDKMYFDYAKVFDKVDLKLLISKLKRYIPWVSKDIYHGFHEKLFSWIGSLLSKRKQVRVQNGVHSHIAKVISGLPQGSCLGLL